MPANPPMVLPRIPHRPNILPPSIKLPSHPPSMLPTVTPMPIASFICISIYGFNDICADEGVDDIQPNHFLTK